MYLEGSVKGAELYVANGEEVSLFPPDTEQFQEGCRFHWRQLLGPKVQLDACKTKKPNFQAPADGLDKLLFEVTVENDLDVITDTVLVFVGEVLGEVQESLGEAIVSEDEMAALPTLGEVLRASAEERAERMEVGKRISDAELFSWTAKAEPMSLRAARGQSENDPRARLEAAAEEPEGPIMPKQGFAKMLTMVRSWIGEKAAE